MMNLARLYEAQRELDARIVRENDLEGIDLLSYKILALQVELGELANEWRGFKYWSKEQKPRTTALRQDTTPNAQGAETYNPLLEEYLDCLHFVLSIGSDLHHEGDIYEIDLLIDGYEVGSNIDQFNLMFSCMSELWNHGEIDSWKDFVGSFIELGNMLGFTWSEVEAAYFAKNAINRARQGSGYPVD